MRFDPVKFMHLVDDLTIEQVGVVSKVMVKLWQFGPMTEAAIRSAARANYDAIRDRMVEVDGGLSFEMVEEAREFGKRSRNQKVAAGQASAAKRKEGPTDVEQPLNERSTSVLSNSLSYSDSGKKERAKEIKTLFCNSKFMVLDVVNESLPELVEERVDLTHYRDSIRNWSDAKDEKRTERGWLATFRQWTKTDRDKGQLKKLAPLQPERVSWNPRS